MSVRLNPQTNELVIERQIRQSGNSAVASIPPSILEAAGIDLGDDVEIAADAVEGEITIREREAQRD